MARRTQLALQRRLKRERAHLQWLEQHLPHTTQLALCRQRIRTLATQRTAEGAKQKKSAAYTTLFPKSYEQLSLLSSPLQLL
jgi:hypothetical protein